MKALSVKQPWAWLIINGYKHLENRNWKAARRGEILIHVGKRVDIEGYYWVKANFPRIPLPSIMQLTTNLGGIIGKVDIIDCIDKSPSPWFQGKYAFVLNNPEPLAFQPCKGKLSFFEVEYNYAD